MPVQLASAYLELIPSMRGFQSTVTRNLSGIGTAEGRSIGSRVSSGVGSGLAVVGKIASGLLGGGLAVAGAVGGLAMSKGLTRALDIQDAQKKLEGLGHSGADVASIMGNALAAVKGTAFGLGDAATVAASAVAAGIQPGKQLTSYLKLTADTATIAGTSLGDMGDILNQATASGKVYTGTLDQLSSRGVPVFQYLAQHYHVTQDALTAMVRKGQVDATTLDQVLQQHLAGSALKSGDTARGAFANVGAAFSRLGVLFVGGPVAEAPHFFQAISTAVDSFGASIKPVADLISGALVSGMKGLEGWLSRLDFTKIAAGARGLASSLQDFYAGLTMSPAEAAGIGAPLDGLVAVGQRVRVAFDAVRKGVGLVGSAIANAFRGKSTDLSGLGTVFSNIGQVVGPLYPILLAVGRGLGGIAGSVGNVIAAGMPVLAHVLDMVTASLKWMGAHPDVIGPIILAVGALAVGMKTLHDVSNIASGFAAPFRAYAATMQALPAIAKLAAAAQWLFNAAMGANPIGIIVLAITGLVAGLVWFFTQTKLGQQIWRNFTTFLVQAWNNIVSVAKVVWAAIANAVSTQIRAVRTVVTAVVTFIVNAWRSNWNLVSSIARTVWSAIVGFVRGYINTVRSVITAVVTAVVNTWRGAWNTARSIITTVWTAISSYVSTAIGRVRSIISSVVSGIASTWRGAWNGIASFLSGVWQRIVSAVSTAVGRVTTVVSGIGGHIRDALSGAATWLYDAGKSIIQGLINGIRDMIGGAANAAKDVMGAIANFFPHSPAKEGPFSGRGWTVYSGRAMATGLAAGLLGGRGTVRGAASDLMSSANLQLQSHASVSAYRPGRASAASVAPTQFVQHLTVNGYSADEVADKVATRSRRSLYLIPGVIA